MEKRKRIKRRARIELFLIGLISGMVLMFSMIILQFKTGFINGVELSDRLMHVEKIVKKIDDTLMLD